MTATIADWLTRRVAHQADQIALIEHSGDKEHSVTWGELDQRADAAAAWFAAHGIQHGQRVGLLLTNQPQEVGYLFGLLRLGAVLVPLNTRLGTEEIRFQLQQTQAQALIVADTASAARLHGEQWTVLTPIDVAPARYPHRPTYQADDALAIIHTSGTSGKPKGAVLTHGSILASAIANEKRIPLSAEDRWLCVLPLYHVGGLSLLFRAAHSGFTVDLYARFDVQTIDTALSTGDVTLISLVPTMLYRLLREGNPAKWRKLRFVLLGGAAASQELLALARQSGVRVATTYGMTEAGSQVATALPDLAEHKPGTVGKPLDGVQIQIVNEARTAISSGQYGEIAIRGDILMREYDNQPQATAHSLQNGWYFSGDIGYLDADGDLFLVQRRSDLIVTGGENVYPAEVEAVLRQHPAVEECVVVGIPDAEWGQRVAVAIMLRDGASSDAATLEAFAREHLAGYKIPRLLRFVRVLPLTASGKIERHRVQEMLMQADSEGS